MRLIEFRVTMYKCFIDSGWVKVNQLTCLVGKNESGKTTLLKALHKLNAGNGEKYNIEREWPRGRRKEKNPSQVVCAARFSLEPADLEEVRKATGFSLLGMPADAVAEVTRTYSNIADVHLDDKCFPRRRIQSQVESLIASLPSPPATLATALGTQFENLRARVQEHIISGGECSDSTLVQAQLAPLSATAQGVEAPAKTELAAYLQALASKMVEIGNKAKNIPTIQQKASEALLPRLPAFIYMDEYRTFTGAALLNQVKERKDKNQMTPEDQTFITILNLAALDLDQETAKATAADREQRKYDLSDAAATLNRDIEGRWRQMRYQVEFHADGFQFFTLVRGLSDQALIRLDERSRGFQWFFSFDLLLMHESKGQFKGCVLLLDEPGLHLHPEAQEDLVKRLEVYAAGNVLIYATHLPYMINLREPDRLRVVSEGTNGSIITEDLSSSQKEGRLTLQAALGISASQSHMVAQRNLVVEGVDDFWVITELSNILIRSGEAGIPEDVLITAAGGAPEVAYLSTFIIGQRLQVVALLDSDPAGQEARDKLVKRWLTRYHGNDDQVLNLGGAVGVSGRDFAIEDLFPEDFYLNYVKEVYRRDIELSGMQLVLSPGGMLCKRVEAALKSMGITFNKGSVAKRIRKFLSTVKVQTEIPPPTLEYARKLIAAVNKALEVASKVKAADHQ
jgi:predicted ATPase